MLAATDRGGSPPSRLAPPRHRRDARLGIPPPRRAHYPCPVAVGRDVLIAPPRHRRGARLGIPRPTAITHAVGRTRITRAARWGHRALPPLRTQNSHRGLASHAKFASRLGIVRKIRIARHARHHFARRKVPAHYLRALPVAARHPAQPRAALKKKARARGAGFPL